jgi:phosphatidate cytidylyltransferase
VNGGGAAAIFRAAAHPMLATRILTAAVLIPLVLAVLFLLPPTGWALAALIFIGAASYEWAVLAGLSHARAIGFVAVTVLTGLVLLFGAGVARASAHSVSLVACALATAFWLLVAPSWLARREPPSPPMLAVAGWVVLIGAWIALVQLQARSPWLVLAAMAIVWIADTAAYFAGRAFGKNKLAPQISPGKTWEGVYGGLAAVAVYALALSPLASSAGYTGAVTAVAVVAFVVCAVALAALSVVGDLTESLLKRHAGVKDSGKLLPGHGGVLDRIDALLAAMPAAALLAWSLLR